MPSDLFSFSVIILAVYRSICLRGGDASPPLYTVFCPVFGQARCPSGASTLPNKGKHVAPPGHISFSSRAQYPTFSSHQYLPISFPFPCNAISPICHPFPFPLTPSFPIHFRPRRQSSNCIKSSKRHLDNCPTPFRQTLPVLPAGSGWIIPNRSLGLACILEF